jgi:hypothetical protein
VRSLRRPGCWRDSSCGLHGGGSHGGRDEVSRFGTREDLILSADGTGGSLVRLHGQPGDSGGTAGMGNQAIRQRARRRALEAATRQRKDRPSGSTARHSPWATPASTARCCTTPRPRPNATASTTHHPGRGRQPVQPAAYRSAAVTMCSSTMRRVASISPSSMASTIVACRSSDMMPGSCVTSWLMMEIRIRPSR